MNLEKMRRYAIELEEETERLNGQLADNEQRLTILRGQISRLESHCDRLYGQIEDLKAENDRLREALEAIAREYEWSDEPTDWAEHDEPAEYAAAKVTAVVNRIALAARAALDVEDGDE